MTYAFIRHGQTDWNRDDKLQGASDIPLNETGRAQALDAARSLVDGGWAAIVSSPLSRARETAELIAAELGITLGPTYDDLRERDYGAGEGLTLDTALKRWPDKRYPGIEHLDSVVARGRAALEQVFREYGNANVLIVCHGTLIRYTLASLADRGFDAILNGSVSTFTRAGAGWQVVSVNGLTVG